MTIKEFAESFEGRRVKKINLSRELEGFGVHGVLSISFEDGAVLELGGMCDCAYICPGSRGTGASTIDLEPAE